MKMLKSLLDQHKMSHAKQIVPILILITGRTDKNADNEISQQDN